MLFTLCSNVKGGGGRLCRPLVAALSLVHGRIGATKLQPKAMLAGCWTIHCFPEGQYPYNRLASSRDRIEYLLQTISFLPGLRMATSR